MYLVILNETRNLFPNQVTLLGGEENITLFSLPATGATLEDAHKMADVLAVEERYIVFASPFLALMALLANEHIPFQVLHNDKREERVTPDGFKAISVIAAEGWQLVP